MQFALWHPYLIAVAIGLLVGIEREKAHPSGKAMGVRTFLLIALCGAIAGGLDETWMAALLGTFTFTLIAISYYSTTKAANSDRGLTTEFAGGIVFALSFVAHTHPVLSTVVGPLVAVVLFSKSSLHRFTGNLKASEFQAALLLLLVGATAVNMLEDRIIDPWGVFNPRKFGLLVLVLGTMQFAGYIAAKILGERRGALVLGFAGGLVSSTAVLLSSAREAKRRKGSSLALQMSVAAAQIAAFAELLIITAVVSPKLCAELTPPVAAAIVTLLLALAMLSRRTQDPHGELELRSPLDWRGVLRLAVVFALILALIAFAQQKLGETASTGVSILAGLFELHGISLANATMFANGGMSLEAAELNTLMALSASLVAKTTIGWIVAGGSFARLLTLISILTGSIVWAVAWFS